ncbi:MAG: hypothetical protein CVT65_12725 [Actinobacteria bacterium HGW-Actinobacteria-5]|nr:MAG: hypothetical protein CVT65_12725 [Actinobacteria bacterium HGW-Actinobacteria-5]
MSSVTDDRFLWSRVLLGVASVGSVVVSVLLFTIDLVMIEQGFRIPAVVSTTPAVMAVAGIVLAGVGGPASRIATGLYGFVAGAGAAIVAALRPDLAGRPLVAAALLGATAIGSAAIIVALREG